MPERSPAPAIAFLWTPWPLRVIYAVKSKRGDAVFTILVAMAVLATQDSLPAEPAPPARHHWFSSAHRHDFSLRKKNVGKYGWQVWIRTDNFTGKIKCYVASLKSATQGRVTYADNTLGFELKGYADPNTTWFMADGNPAQKLSSVWPTVYGRGQAVPPMSVANLDRTIVLIPMESVLGSDHVFIRTTDTAKPKSFRLIGLEDALRAARDNGCTDGNYVRDPF